MILQISKKQRGRRDEDGDSATFLPHNLFRMDQGFQGILRESANFFSLHMLLERREPLRFFKVLHQTRLSVREKKLNCHARLLTFLATCAKLCPRNVQRQRCDELKHNICCTVNQAASSQRTPRKRKRSQRSPPKNILTVLQS